MVATILAAYSSYAQIESFWANDSTFVKDLYVLKNKYQSLSFTGYLQVQYQYADSAGIKSYNGGDFATYSDNRFMIRRGRFRMDYERKTINGFYKYYFALQFDGTERGVFIRDMFGRIYENKWNYFVVSAGVFNRPFGYELNLSSSMRESPERGRMSQILMKTERDIGAMVSFEPQDKKKWIYPLKIDVGVFNGQGIAGTEDYDSFKDIIVRTSVRKTPVTKNFYISGGLSYLNGGFRNGSRYIYKTKMNSSGEYVATADISDVNIEKKAPRIYYGADLQIVYENSIGKTELRLEYIKGTQSATFKSSVTPAALPKNKFGKADSIFVRNFDGLYFYFLHTFKKKHQVLAKFDCFDSNTKIKGQEIIDSRSFSDADIRYNTFGLGYIYYMNDNVKVVLYYDHPINEKTGLKGYSKDLTDDTYTCRVQFRF